MKNDILRGHTEHIILSILKLSPTNGVTLLNKVNNTLDQEFEIKKITMYKTLNRLEEAHYVTSVRKGKENIYSITENGIHHLHDLSKEWDYTKSIIDGYDHLSDTIIGNRIIHIKETTSTNDLIKEYLNVNNDGLIIHTDFQSKGKGRLNRIWEADSKSSIMMSVLLYPEIEISEVGLLTQVAAASIFDTLNYYGIDGLSIKWPNDIMIDLQKVSGVLVESKLSHNRVEYVIIGIGLNINSSKFSDEVIYKATSLNEHLETTVDRDEVMQLLIRNLNKYYHQYLNKEYNFLSVCRNNSFLIGKYVTLNIDGQEVVEVVGINDSGELLINRDGMIESVLLNEVSLSSVYGGTENDK